VPNTLTLSASEQAAVRAFVDRAREMLGADLREIRLFGSRARGQGREDSDVDLAVIVTEAGRARRHTLYDLAYDVGFAHRVELAPLVIEERRLDELRARERLLAREIDTDGIRL
jgi:predicted nucleotidyltransferase